MNNITASQVANAMKKLNMVVFDGQYDITICGIRSLTQTPNSFDDKLVMLYHDEKRRLNIKQWDITTDPGLYWLQKPMRTEGTAIMVHDKQYRGVYRLQPNGHKGYTAWKQIGKIAFVRDNDRDNYLDFDLMNNTNNITWDIIGANIHMAGLASVRVDKWSAGCQVFARKNDFIDAIKFAQSCEKRGWGNIYSYALISEKHL